MSKTPTKEELQKNIETLAINTAIASLAFLKPKLVFVAEKLESVIESLEKLKQE